jgi:hypothetical protein
VWNLGDPSMENRWMETGWGKCVNTTWSQSLGHRQLCFTYDQDRYMFRCSSSCSPGVWRDQISDFDRRSRWLSCGHTQEHMWTCDMKTSMGHWRHHLVSWMFYILHTIEQGCPLARSKELFVMSYVEIYEQNKTWWHLNFRTHTTNTVK